MAKKKTPTAETSEDSFLDAPVDDSAEETPAADEPVTVEAEATAPAEEPAAVAASAGPDRGVVARAVSISWGGQIIKLHEGDTVSDESYGTGAVQRMRDAGVAMRD